MDLVFERCWRSVAQGVHKEFVTGNNDADAVYFLYWVRERFPEMVDHLRAKLALWGGNASGVNVANIDNLGNVHPDTFWWHYTLGNVRERPFSEIWQDTSDPIMAGLKAKPAGDLGPLRRVPPTSTSAAAIPACGRCSSPATRSRKIPPATSRTRRSASRRRPASRCSPIESAPVRLPPASLRCSPSRPRSPRRRRMVLCSSGQHCASLPRRRPAGRYRPGVAAREPRAPRARAGQRCHRERPDANADAGLRRPALSRRDRGAGRR